MLRPGLGEEAMFGKPQWFVPKSFGWGLHPVTWQGWAYTGVWTSLIVVPFLILLTRYQPGEGPRVMEASIWLGASVSALVYDVYLILQQIRGPAKQDQA